MPAAPNIPTLPLSASLLSSLQPATYLHHNLTHTGLRPTSSRKPLETRQASCTTGSLAHCAGSSLVRIGDTAVVCGIQPEILLHSDVPDPPRERLVPPKSKTEEQIREQEDIADLSLLVPNVELNTGCHPSFLPGEGKAPGQLQQSLAVQLLRLLVSTRLIPLSDLTIHRDHGPQNPASSSIEETSENTGDVIGYWVLYISLLPLSLDGVDSLIDVLWLALTAALRDVRLPLARWDADREGIVCSEVASEAQQLHLRGRPISLTFGVFAPGPHIWTVDTSESQGADPMEDVDTPKRWLLADPDGFEDALCEEHLTVVVDKSKRGKMKMLALQKTGGVSMGPEEVMTLVEQAKVRWKDLVSELPAG